VLALLAAVALSCTPKPQTECNARSNAGSAKGAFKLTSGAVKIRCNWLNF
jgi:hypothetical protein